MNASALAPADNSTNPPGPHAAGPGTTGPAAQPGPTNLTVLLIEDDPAGSLNVPDVLDSAGKPIRVRTARNLTDPNSGPSGGGGSPWANAGFDRIRKACRKTLTDFEWHLVEVLFVEATHTRGDLAADPWVLEQLGISASDSESKRRRHLNLFIDEALARLGRALQECDL